VENSVFRGNSARYGGAITAKGLLQVSDSYFTEQVARFTGGAINTAAGSDAIILNSEFTYNKVRSSYT
jgi:predicted outer membrane repeat protein